MFKLQMLTLFFGFICLTIAVTDYCSTSLCSTGVRHIACGHSGTFSPNCSSDAAIINIDEKLKAFIINTHNTKRNFIAGGGHSKHNKACRMATMKWDNELAKLAALNVMQCDMIHDRCHNTETLRYSGQNLAWIGYFGTPNVTQLMNRTINMWYDEVQYSNMTYINSYPSSYRGPAIGHFTVMMAEKNILTGCAVSTYSKPNVPYKYFLTACNYATTNMVGFPIYTACNRTASNCNTGRNSQFTNLCSISEVYNVNQWQR